MTTDLASLSNTKRTTSLKEDKLAITFIFIYNSSPRWQPSPHHHHTCEYVLISHIIRNSQFCRLFSEEFFCQCLKQHICIWWRWFGEICKLLDWFQRLSRQWAHFDCTDLMLNSWLTHERIGLWRTHVKRDFAFFFFFNYVSEPTAPCTWSKLLEHLGKRSPRSGGMEEGGITHTSKAQSWKDEVDTLQQD